jgi:hypothetical protein
VMRSSSSSDGVKISEPRGVATVNTMPRDSRVSCVPLDVCVEMPTADSDSGICLDVDSGSARNYSFTDPVIPET